MLEHTHAVLEPRTKEQFLRSFINKTNGSTLAYLKIHCRRQHPLPNTTLDEDTQHGIDAFNEMMADIDAKIAKQRNMEDIGFDTIEPIDLAHRLNHVATWAQNECLTINGNNRQYLPTLLTTLKFQVGQEAKVSDQFVKNKIAALRQMGREATPEVIKAIMLTSQQRNQDSTRELLPYLLNEIESMPDLKPAERKLETLEEMDLAINFNEEQEVDAVIAKLPIHVQLRILANIHNAFVVASDVVFSNYIARDSAKSFSELGLLDIQIKKIKNAFEEFVEHHSEAIDDNLARGGSIPALQEPNSRAKAAA